MRVLARFATLFFILLMVVGTSATYAADKLTVEQNRLAVAQRQLAIDKQFNEIAQQQLKNQETRREQLYVKLKQGQVTPNVIHHTELDQVAAKSTIDGIKIAISASHELIVGTQSNIDFLTQERQRLLLLGHSKDTLQDEKLQAVEQRLELSNDLLKVEKDRLKALQQSLKTAEEHLELVTEWYNKVSNLYQKQAREQEQETLASQMDDFQKSLQYWLSKLSDLNSQMQALSAKDSPTETEITELQLKVIEASERIEMTRNQIWLLRLQNSIESLQVPAHKIHAITYLNTLDKRANKTLLQLKKHKKYVSSKIEYMVSKKDEYKKSLSADQQEKALLLVSSLGQDYSNQLNVVEQLILQTSQLQKDIKNHLNQQLSIRQDLPAFNIENWITLGGNILKLPGMGLHAAQTTYAQSTIALKEVSIWLMYIWVVFLMIFVGIMWYLNKKLLILVSVLEDKRDRFSTNITYITANIIYRNFKIVSLVLGLALIAFLIGVNFSLFIYLLLVYLLFKVLLDFTKIALLESESDIEGGDVKLYHQVKWVLLLGGVLTFIVVLTHQLPVAYEVKALSNRVYMLFVLLVGVIVFLAREALPNLFIAKLPTRRKYLYHVLRLLSILIPFSLVTNAVIGLFGYVELAWQISKYQGYFILVMAVYLIARGLLIDAVDFTCEYFIRNVRNGWVWVESVLKPLDKIIRISLFILMLVVLGYCYDLHRSQAFISGIVAFFTKPIFEFLGNNISLLTIIELFIIGAVIYWLSRWSREFSFRWFYAKARDVGVRNSLSVFTQYLVVVTASLIALNLMGINFKGLAVVAAAFAAGIGFGLRDMASNFFSGILLLIERPFRTGDIVTLGEFEGRVVSTGIRSLTIRTWDYMDVIVPNSDMFSKAFVNWTHQDSLVRTVIQLRINRVDNPYFVKQLIFDVLAENKSVVDKPEFEVLMMEINTSLIEMEVRYYIMVSLTCSRVTVKSEVLFGIWDTFQKNGIHAPIEQFDLAVKQLSAVSSNGDYQTDQ